MAQRIQLLGSLQVETNGEPSPLLKNAKGCALLAYLLVTQQTQPREVVAELLWESDTTAKSLKNLRTLLPHMRRWLPDLVVTRQHVTYTPEADDFVDLFALRAAIAQADVMQLDMGLQLYKGPLLDAFLLSDVMAFNEWLTLERENLRQSVITAYHRLCRAYAQQQQWEKGVAAAQRWLTIDPLDEEALRQLMQFLAASGQVAVAIQQYKHSRQQLQDVLGVEPSHATEALAQKLAQLQAEQGAGLMWDQIVGAQLQLPAVDELAEPGELPPNSMLPYQRNHDFVGRRQPLLDLAQLLLPKSSNKRPFTRTVAVTGMGGVGKTQLAAEFAYRYGRYFPGGVYWLSFAEANNVAAEVAGIGSERGMGLYQDSAQLTLKDQVGRVQKAWQEAIPRLLIFDNCEDEALLADWLPKTGGCRVLLTSRRQQWVHTLGVTVQSLATLSPTASVALLKRAASMLDAEDAAAIAGEVGHLPLALHLAGGFLRRYRTVTPVTYLHQLRVQGALVHPSLRGRGTNYSPTGHELDVSRTFIINFEQLNANDEIDAVARQLLLHAACLAPGEPIPRQLLLDTVADETNIEAMLAAEDGLARLVALGFLYDDGEQMVVLHRLLALFVQGVVDADSWYVGETAVADLLCQRIRYQLQHTGSLFFLPIAYSHLHHLTQALLPQGAIVAGKLANLLGLHLSMIADFDKVEPYFQSGLMIYEKRYGRNHPETARCFDNFFVLYLDRGEYAKACDMLEKGLSIHQTLSADFDERKGVTLNNLGYVLTYRGDYQTAKTHLRHAVDILKQLGETDNPRAAIFINNLGLACMFLAEYEEAAALMKRGLAIREATLGEIHPYTAVSWHNLGRLHLRQQQFEQAEVCLTKALTIRKQVLDENHPHNGRGFHMLGLLHFALGDYAKAKVYYEKALIIQSRMVNGTHPERGLTLKDLGDLYQQMEPPNLSQAKLCYKQARALLAPALLPTHLYLRQIKAALQQATMMV